MGITDDDDELSAVERQPGIEVGGREAPSLGIGNDSREPLAGKLRQASGGHPGLRLELDHERRSVEPSWTLIADGSACSLAPELTVGLGLGAPGGRPRGDVADARSCLAQPVFWNPTVVDCCHECVANGEHGFAEEVVPEPKRIRPRADRTNGALLDTDRIADRLHLERVRHDQSGEAELTSQKVVQDVPAHRGGRLIERADDDVGAHDRLRSSLERRMERRERPRIELVDHREREVRVNGRVAVPREMLRARRDARTLQTGHERGYMPRAEISVGAERADPDHRVLWIRIDVGDGCEVEVDPGSGELRSERRGDTFRRRDVIDHAESCVPGVRAACRRLEPRDVAALLVDRDHDVGPLGAQIVGQATELLSALDVPRVEHDAAEPVGEVAAYPVGDGKPLESRQDAAQREPLKLMHQALTAPAVRPKAIFRWTMRKKMTTGIAVSVEAAISAPQSVARLVP